MPTAFVTGAGDLVGLNLIEVLQSSGWEVKGLAGPEGHVEYLDRLGVEYTQGDLGSLKVMRQAMPDKVDAVFHAVHNVSLWSKDAEMQTRANVKGTQVIVQVALEKNIKRFIHTSSIVAYGLHRGTVTEDTPSTASSSNINFVKTKGKAEQIVKRACRKGLNAVIINPANMIGPYDFHGWARLFRLVKQRRMPIMAAGGGSFCHPRAVAQAQVTAVKRGRIGSNYLLGGANATYLDLLRMIGTLMKRRTLPRAMPSNVLRSMAAVDEGLSAVLRLRPTITRETVEMLAAHTYCNSTRAIKELGYEPVELSVMLQECYDWMRAEGQI